jgi:hypothetical protein
MKLAAGALVIVSDNVTAPSWSSLRIRPAAQ